MGYMPKNYSLLLSEGRQKKTVMVMSICFRIRPSGFESQVLILKKQSNLSDPPFFLICKMGIKNSYPLGLL